MKQIHLLIMKLVARLFIVAAAGSMSSLVWAGPTELLQNGSFESPVVPANGNNFYSTIPNWTVVSTTPVVSQPFNVIRPFTGYGGGPSTTPPNGGTQYLDITSADGIISQNFTLPWAGTIDIGAYFSVRDFPQAVTGNIVRVKDSAGTILASANVSFTAAEPLGIWKQASQSNISLPAGTYTLELVIPNYSNVDITSVQYTPAPIAVADATTVQYSAGQRPNVLNVLTGDTLAGISASTSNVTISVASGSTVPPSLLLDITTGQISVAAGANPGTYSFNYQICEIGFPANCATSTATVNVTPVADLSISKSNNTAFVYSGSSVTYTLTAKNDGPNTVLGAIIQDTPGVGINCPASNPVSISGPAAPAGIFTFADLAGAGIVLGSLGSGQTTTLTYSCLVL